MAGKATRIQRATEREARLQDQLVLQFESELEALLRRVDRQITALVHELAADDGRLVATRASLGRAIRTRNDLVRVVQTAGFHALADRAVSDRFDALAKHVLETDTIAAAAATTTALDVETITALKELHLAELLDWSEGVSLSAWRLVLDGVLGLQPVDRLVVDLGELLDTSLPRARTLYDTAVSTFSRQVGLLHVTGEADELFYYAGPLDSVTRPFCLERVGKVFSRAEIDQMDNGQLPNVLVTGGGYNCRHAFKRVSVLDEELIHLHETGERLPHVQQQLDKLRKQAA